MPGDRIWNGILLIIAHSAALSRMLFPQLLSNKTVEKFTPEQLARHERGQQLRTWLQISNDSPLSTDGRELRNTIEHWDEKIDQWFLDDSVGKFVIGMEIGFPPAEWAEETAKEYSIRFYDPPTQTVMVGHVTLDLDLLLTEVVKLQENFRKVRSDLMSDRARARYRTPPR